MSTAFGDRHTNSFRGAARSSAADARPVQGPPSLLVLHRHLNGACDTRNERYENLGGVGAAVHSVAGCGIAVGLSLR
jgi:hypothetical protein